MWNTAAGQFHFDFISPFGYFASLLVDGELFFGVESFATLEQWLACGGW